MLSIFFGKCKLGLSVFLIFLLFFRADTLLSIGYIFMSSIQKNRQILPHVRQSIHFKKNHRVMLESGVWKNKLGGVSC